MTTRRWALTGVIGLVAALSAGTSNASAAATSRGLNVTLIDFAPVHDSAHERVTLAAEGCGASKPLSLLYSERRGRAQLLHDYRGRLSSCQLNRTFTAGTLTARWSTALNLDLQLTATAPPRTRRVRVAKGCAETSTSATYRATGTVDAAIHAAKLGRLGRPSLTARLLRISIPSCALGSNSGGSFSSILTGGGSGSASGSGASLAALLNGDQLQAQWGANESIQALESHGSPSTVDFSEPARDGPTPTVTDTFGFDLIGGGAFRPAADLSSAALNFASPVSAGALTFTAGIGCPPTIRAQDGTFSGMATIDDPVLGTVTISGSLMAEGQLSVVAADGEKCAPANLQGE